MSTNESPIFTAMTFNVAHGRGQRFHQTLVKRPAMERNLQEIARHILLYNPDIVALQEIDQGSFWNHRLDQLEYLRELTLYAHAHHGIHKDDFLFFKQLVLKYGVGILSRLEPLDFVSQPFSLGRLDSKGFTSKRLVFHDRKMAVVALHLDFKSDKRRLRQVHQLIEHVDRIRADVDHLILMGDFNCTTQKPSSPLLVLMRELQLHTYEPHAQQGHISFPGLLARRLDYILVDHGLTFVEYRTGDARISDHEYVVARIQVPIARIDLAS